LEERMGKSEIFNILINLLELRWEDIIDDEDVEEEVSD
jgi:hypothetical protein